MLGTGRQHTRLGKRSDAARIDPKRTLESVSLSTVKRLLWRLAPDDGAFELSRRILLALEAGDLVGLRTGDENQTGSRLAPLYRTRGRLFSERGIVTYGFRHAIERLRANAGALQECHLTLRTWHAVVFYQSCPARFSGCLGYDRHATPAFLLSENRNPLWEPEPRDLALDALLDERKTA